MNRAEDSGNRSVPPAAGSGVGKKSAGTMAVYSLLLSAGLVASAPWWIWRLLRTARYREGLPERLGKVPAALRSAVAGRQVVWLHAVSVGELLAAAQLVTELEKALNAAALEGERWEVVISTTTPTGQALARERFGAGRVFWFPLDFAWAVRAWMAALRPRLLVLVESELWPRLLTEAARLQVPVAVVNARVSDRSFRRARRLRWLWSRLLAQVTVFFPQSGEAAYRLRQLGVPPERIRPMGNLKFDAAPHSTSTVHTLRQLLGRRPLVVAGSLADGEEKVVLSAWKAAAMDPQQPLLLLAPRHPEHFTRVTLEARQHFSALRVSTLLAAAPEERSALIESAGVLILDTIGDLAALYALADVAFVGGSLVRRGGQNPLEPARFGVPVIMGPSFENFREIVRDMQQVDGIEMVANAAALRSALLHLLQDPLAADALGQRGRKVFLEHSGVTQRTAQELVELFQPSGASLTAPAEISR